MGQDDDGRSQRWLYPENILKLRKTRADNVDVV